MSLTRDLTIPTLTEPDTSGLSEQDANFIRQYWKIKPEKKRSSSAWIVSNSELKQFQKSEHHLSVHAYADYLARPVYIENQKCSCCKKPLFFIKRSDMNLALLYCAKIECQTSYQAELDLVRKKEHEALKARQNEEYRIILEQDEALINAIKAKAFANQNAWTQNLLNGISLYDLLVMYSECLTMQEDGEFKPGIIPKTISDAYLVVTHIEIKYFGPKFLGDFDENTNLTKYGILKAPKEIWSKSDFLNELKYALVQYDQAEINTTRLCIRELGVQSEFVDCVGIRDDAMPVFNDYIKLLSKKLLHNHSLSHVLCAYTYSLKHQQTLQKHSPSGSDTPGYIASSITDTIQTILSEPNFIKPFDIAEIKEKLVVAWNELGLPDLDPAPSTTMLPMDEFLNGAMRSLAMYAAVPTVKHNQYQTEPKPALNYYNKKVRLII